MNILSQRDPRWANIKLGTSNSTIYFYGCTITSLAMILGTTPDVVNRRLKDVDGFSNGNLIVWSKVEAAFPGIKAKRVRGYDNNDVLYNIPNVLVEVPAYPIGGNGSHWVVYTGNKQLADPWTGKIRPTSDFPNPTGYTVLTGKWKSDPPLDDKYQPYKDRIQQLDKIQQDIKNVLASNDLWWTKLDKITKLVNSGG